MVTYLSYRINRDTLENYVQDKQKKISDKYEKYLQLISLDGLDTGIAQFNQNLQKTKK